MEMDFWNSLGAAFLVVIAGWMFYRLYTTKPELFSMKNFGKTAQTLAFIAILLIVVVAFCYFSLMS